MPTRAGESELQILLRDVAHDISGVKLALKCEQLTIAFNKSPSQVPVGREVSLVDIGYVKPTITISGTIENSANFPASNTTDRWGMEVLTINSQTYYVPYKNYLEDFLITTPINASYKMQIEIGDATTQISTVTADATGGSIYGVIPQQFQFTMLPGQEDRWLFTIAFLAVTRGKDHATNDI
tara:strand:+ start:4870 stop:5415 length:546 start_codon:yes stop_codon:yes gene_type:complete